MRKIVVFNMISVDGYFAGIDGNIDWHVADDEFNKAAVDIIQQFDTILFGRVTYELFKSYWPNALNDSALSKEDHFIANKINEMTKVVFSRSPIDTSWENTQLTQGDIESEISKLKASSGQDIVIYGSGTIVQQLTDLGLIDEYRLMINPVILGDGKPMFKGVRQMSLKRTDIRSFESGNVLMTYVQI